MVSLQTCISGFLLAMFLSGCATQAITAVTPSEAQIARYSNLSALDVVTALEKNVNDARNDNMPFLAPYYYREAFQILSESQRALGNKPRDVLANNAAKGDAVLEKGRAVMAIVQYRYARELELKARLDRLNTAGLLPKEYEKVVGDLSGLIEQVEREQPENIDRDKEALIKAMQELEVKAILEGALHESEMINADSKEKNAEKQAPATFAEALHAYLEAKNQIAAAPHDEELVQRSGAQALFAARHARQVNARVALLQTHFKCAAGSSTPSAGATGGLLGTQSKAQANGKPPGMEKGPVERIVLQEEDRLLGISIAMGHKDLRDQPLEKQVEEIRRVAGELARGAKGGVDAGYTQDLEARLKTANDATRQAMAQIEVKDRQLAEKDAQIETLSARIAGLEGADQPTATPGDAGPTNK